MKRFSLLMILALLVLLPAFAQAQYYGRDAQVNPYLRRDGTYIQPHHRTIPDGNPFNNYSTRGNVNPYTGQMGTVNPYQINPYSSPYRQPRQTWP